MVKKIHNDINFSIIFVFLILWQMLLPGYILTLDMVFTPHLEFYLAANNFYNNLPLIYSLKFLNLFLSGWIIQKIMLIALFFCLFYLAVRFLPIPKKCHANYWGALFFAINPFVYERFLAGHWTHLFAYAFLPPFIFYLFKFAKSPGWQNSSWLFGWLFLIGIFSLHFLVMAILILMPYLFFVVLKNLIIKNKRKAKDILIFTLIFGIFFIIINSYWLIPYLFNPQKSIINNFTQENLEAFKTSGDAILGANLNVLSLYGFWQESQPWANYWLWPKDNFIFWSILAMGLAAIILIGAIKGLKDKTCRGKALFFLTLSFFAFTFSAGLGETIFKSLNQWLFENLFFWRGFRDSNKFSGFLALSYAYLGSYGLVFIINKLQKYKIANLALIALFSFPLFYTYPMLGGFARQLQPVWYPQSWHQINEILNLDNQEFKVLFLPWHQYLSLNFNHQLITANPAKAFFGKEIIQGQNMELGNIFTTANDHDYQEIEKLIINSNKNPDEIIADLQTKHIKYIIFAHDLIEQDTFTYQFLNSKKLWKTFNSTEITFYKIADF